MKQTDIAWAAGFIDGEGYFGLTSRGHVPEIRVRNTDRKPLYKLQELFGGQIYADGYAFAWMIGKPQVLSVTQQLLEHLVSKKYQAELILTWHDRMSIEELDRLNTKLRIAKGSSSVGRGRPFKDE